MNHPLCPPSWLPIRSILRKGHYIHITFITDMFIIVLFYYCHCQSPVLELSGHMWSACSSVAGWMCDQGRPLLTLGPHFLCCGVRGQDWKIPKFLLSHWKYCVVFRDFLAMGETQIQAKWCEDQGNYPKSGRLPSTQRSSLFRWPLPEGFPAPLRTPHSGENSLKHIGQWVKKTGDLVLGRMWESSVRNFPQKPGAWEQTQSWV